MIVKAWLFFIIGVSLWDHLRVAEARGFSRFCGGVGFWAVEIAVLDVACCFWVLGMS